MKPNLRETLAPMTWKEKKDYIWEYYKIHIIACVFLIVIVASTIVGAMGRTEIYVNIVLMGNTQLTMEAGEISERLNKDFLSKEEQENKEIQIAAVYQTDDLRNEMARASMQRTVAQLAAGELDFMIVDRDDLVDLLSQGEFLAFNELEGFDINELGDHEVVKGEDGNSIYGISMKDMEVFREYEFSRDKVICIPANAGRTENIVNLLNHFLGK